MKKFKFRKWIKYLGYVVSVVFTIVTTILAFIPFKEDTSVLVKLLHLVGLMILAIVISLIVYLCVNKNKIWSFNNRNCIVRYGDLFKIAKKKKQKIIVIPVNDTFETIYDEKSEGIDKPLVDVNTVHGKWLKHLYEIEDMLPKDVDDRIQNDLQLRNYNYSIVKKERGNTKSFPNGTIAVFEHKSTAYYLLSISKFDENNKATSNKDTIISAIESLLQFYDINGQSKTIYVPLIGTGKSRANLSTFQSLDILKNEITLFNSDKATGNFNIVIYSKDESDVTIYD